MIQLCKGIRLGILSFKFIKSPHHQIVDRSQSLIWLFSVYLGASCHFV